MEFDINALVNAVVAKSDAGNRVKREYLSSKVFKFESPDKKKGEEMVTYIVKLLPWTKDGAEGFAKTYVYRYQYRWQGFPEPGQKFGKWNYVTSAGNFGEACPIDEWRKEFLAANTGNSEEIKRVLKPLNRNEVRVMNILMVDDPHHPENNGKVFPVELNKALWDIVDGALHGQLDEHFTEIRGSAVKVAPKVFDLSPNGINLKVCVTLNEGNIPQYSKSEMTFKKVDLFGDNGIVVSSDDKLKMIEGELTLKELIMKRIEEDMIDPMELVKDGIRPYAEVKKLFVKTFLSNPKISMHVSAKWMSEEETVKPAPKVVKEDTTSVKKEVEEDYDLDETDGAIPSFDADDDMDAFMKELAEEQGE